MVWKARQIGGRPVPALGAGLLLLTSVLCVGCGADGGGTPDPEVEAARALGLPPGARIHRVLLGGRGAEEHLLPHRVRAAPGDAIEFLTVDNRIHTISFLVDSIPLGAVEFLDASGASASPPLVTRGSRFVVRLEGAPLGSYPFVSRGHGGEARGVIELATSPEPTPDPGG